MLPAQFGSDGWPPSGQKPGASRVSSAWKLLAAFSVVLQLVGYLMLSVVFGGPDEKLLVNQTASAACAWLLISASYAASIVLAGVQRHRKLFLLRSVFLSVFRIPRYFLSGIETDDVARPYMITNLVALFDVLFNILGRDLFPLNARQVAAISLPSAFSVIYGLAAFLIYHEFGSSRGHRAEDGTPLLSEEEMQRQQLLRLLQERNTSAPRPDLVQNTYRLDLPVGVDPVQKSWDAPLATPFDSGSQSSGWRGET